MFHLRRRLEQTPKEFEFLRNKLSQSREQLDHAQAQNERLAGALGQAKDQIAALRAEVDKLAAPPSSYGTILQVHPDDTVDVWTGGRKLKVNVTPGVDPAALRRGREVVLNEALNVVDLSGGDPQGEIVRLKDRLDETRVMVTLRADEERVVELAADLVRRLAAGGPAAAGRQGGGGPGEAPQGGGRGPGPGRGPQHHLHRYRRAGGADRPDPRRHRVARPVRRPFCGAQAVASQGGAAVRATRVRQDPHRQSGGQRAWRSSSAGRPARPAGRTSST